ncbi:hypothetical protein AB6A40_005705 [Gnathostoma spinigerum]|uniref:Hexamerin n=1 Tax=Gnathostoma spinigerum TaxID=75299 RepID=A0ABD6EH03_9BILA
MTVTLMDPFRLFFRPNLKHVIDGTETGRDGYFELDGYDHDETSPFQPVIVIYHQCGQLKRYNLTHQSFNIRIPQMYINSKDVFDIGTLNLEPIYPGQKGQVKFEQYSRPLQVRGDLECTTNNAAKKIVQMFASNRKDSNTFIAEEQLERSHFTVNSARAMLTDPFILIAHQCDLTADQVNQDIFRQFNIHIPFYYYNAGRIGLKTFDIGTFNLEVMYPGETLGQIATY